MSTDTAFRLVSIRPLIDTDTDTPKMRVVSTIYGVSTDTYRHDTTRVDCVACVDGVAKGRRMGMEKGMEMGMEIQ